MNIIICLDDKNGMMFNKRRQSQDKILRADIKELVKNNILYMNNYSYKLYKDIDDGNIQVCEDFLEQCNSNDFCLVENETLNNIINIKTNIYFLLMFIISTCKFIKIVNNSSIKLIIKIIVS